MLITLVRPSVVQIREKILKKYLAEKDGCSAHALDINDKKDAFKNIITRSRHHPSIVAIEQRRHPETFNFTKFSVDDVSSELNKLDLTKSTTGVNIRLLKENSEN